MASEISNQPMVGYGQISRAGTTQDGRVIYQMSDGAGRNVGKISVAGKDADTFEKCKNTILQNAPKIENYMKSMTPEKEEKLKKKTKWIIGSGILAGSAVPLFGVKNWSVWLRIVLTIVGGAAGAIAGSKIAVKATTPPGMVEFANATKIINQLDVQKIE